MFNIKALITSIIVSVLGYSAWIAYNEFAAIADAMGRVGVGGVIFICILSLVNYGLRFIRWHGFYLQMGYTIPWRQNLSYYLAGFALTTTPGKAGEAIRSLYLKKHDVPVASSLAALLAERFSDLLAVTILALLVLYHFPEYSWFAGVAALICVSVLIFIQNKTFIHGLQNIAHKFKAKKIDQSLQHGLNMMQETMTLLGASALLKSLVISTVAWSAEAYGFYYLVTAMGYGHLLVILMGIYALSMLIGALSFLPGGLGSVEAVMSFMLIAIGLTGSDAVSSTILCRLTTLWLAVAIGLIMLSYLEAQRIKLNKTVLGL